MTQATLSSEESISTAIDSGDIVRICSEAGLLLEQISNTLSVQLGTTIHRKRGDRYTLSDLWSGISKTLRKTELKEIIESIETHIHLRNLIGAHYNEWALSLSLTEAKTFAESVLFLFLSVKCEKCSGWISSNLNQTFLSCKCGNIIIN